MSSKKFAIIIGIDDYATQPLKFCTSDAIAMKDALIKFGRFEEKNITSIISNDENPIKDITGKYYEATRKIKETFNANHDSIFFYFAGHGTRTGNKSTLVFQDSHYHIPSIFDDLSKLEPKLQFYVIDACNSGGKVLSRSTKEPKIDLLDKFTDNCNGVLFLYACQETETASELAELKHGMMTHHFLNALETPELYDEDGILTPGRIQEYVSKETAKMSDFQQLPVIENRLTGFYPFAFLPTADIAETDAEVPAAPGEAARALETKAILNYSYENRIELQKMIVSNMKTRIDSFPPPSGPEYLIQEFSRIRDLPLSNRAEFINRFVNGIDKNNLEAIGDAIIIKKVRNPQYNPFANVTRPIAAILGDYRQVEPEYNVTYTINDDNDFIKSNFRIFRSKSIMKVSYGVGFVVYQAKWGLVLCSSYFQIDWDGEEDSIARPIIWQYLPLKLCEESVVHVRSILNETLFEKYPAIVELWNQERATALSDFENRTTISKDKPVPGNE